MNFIDFARMSREEKLRLIEDAGVLLDTDVVTHGFIKLFFVHGFFVEQVEDVAGNITDLIPYRNGYRLNHFLN